MAQWAPDGFWSGYLGNLMATVAGVAIGIPAGLAINRQAESHRQQSEEQARAEQLVHQLSQVGASIARIEDASGQVVKDAEGAHVVPTGLDYQTWRALSPVVLPQLARFGDLGARASAALADFFTETEVVQHMLDQQLQENFSATKVTLADGSKVSTRVVITAAVGDRAALLQAQCHDVLALVEQMKGQVSGGDEGGTSSPGTQGGS